MPLARVSVGRELDQLSPRDRMNPLDHWTLFRELERGFWLQRGFLVLGCFVILCCCLVLSF